MVQETYQPALIVHGGAWAIPDNQVAGHLSAVSNAAQIGWQVLQQGGSALDAVEQAIVALEDHPAVNAGRGATLTRDGKAELDALIMDGRNLGLGCTANIRTVRNPIRLARAIMERTPHTLIVGPAADELAAQFGLEIVPPEYFITEAMRNEWQAHQQGGSDTVGCAARDGAGNLAAGTSTGGMTGKWSGRVGDCPLVGSGGYADNYSAAVSATGWGETLMKVVISKTACDFSAAGLAAQAAAEKAIEYLTQRVNGSGGLILVDRFGNFGAAHNTPRMAQARVYPDGRIEAFC
ncbi:MAG TPA: isoaspartyl peptidase/L-asparaginase [Anaerolineales bacterium]|nr:isoaspartyl peptidase/L-asparaginase [Anaerolineales bacterium]